MFTHVDELNNYLGEQTFKDVNIYFDSFLSERKNITSLSLKDIDHITLWLAFTEQQKEEIVQKWVIINQDESLLDALRFLKYVLIIKAHPSDWIIKNPPIINHNLIDIPFFQLYTLLNVITDSVSLAKMREIDQKYIDFNLGHLKNYIRNYTTKHNALGINNFGWCTYLATIGLIELKALNFMHHKYNDPYVVYKSKINHSLIVLATHDLNIRFDGQLDGTNKIFNKSFTTSLTVTNRDVTGYLVNPLGFVENHKITLQLDNYECILKKGDDVIDFHIPTRKGYEVKDIKSSFIEAKSFFQKHYPEYIYKAFWCISWLYSPQIPFFITKPTSNIIKIANQGYRCPATPGQSSLFNFVFQTETPDFTQIKPKTSLEKGVIDYVEQGGKINNGLYLYMIDDIDLFGQEPYINKEYLKILNHLGGLSQ